MSPSASLRHPDRHDDALVASWDARAHHWDEWAPVIEDWFRPASRAMLTALELSRGAKVLELAAGTGGMTRRLARAVGAEGWVLATDSGRRMIARARGNLAREGFTNVRARVMDGGNPALPGVSVDAVACRQGFFFFRRPARALHRLRRILRPGGRIVLTVFSSPAENGFLVMPSSVLTRWAGSGGRTPPSDGEPGPFRWAAPGQLAGALRAAGFSSVRSRTVSCPLRLSTGKRFVDFYREVVGLDYVLHDIPPEVRASAWSEVATRAAKWARRPSAGAPCKIRVLSGRRPLD